MTRLRDQILAALDHEFRPSREIAKRAGLDATQVAPALGHMRQRGIVECAPGGPSPVWRLMPLVNGRGTRRM
jgi:predicted Rossmann fold nucleotide-binding protein DprA/Smf involved in DNA uptake